MNKPLGSLVVAALSLALLAAPASAVQRGSVEMGYDLGFTATLWDDTDFGDPDDLLTLGLPASDARFVLFPVSRLRFGFHLTEQSQLEPSVGFLLLNVEDETLTSFALGLDYMHNFGQARTRPFVKLGGRLWTLSNGESLSQFGLGGGVGARTTVGDRLALRYGVDVLRQFESEDEILGHWDIGLQFGLSFYTR